MIAQAKPEVSLWAALGFFVFVISFLSIYFRFARVIAPKAFDRWASENDFKVIQRKEAGIIKRFTARVSSTQMLYEIVVQNGSGKQQSGLVIVGLYWLPSLSVERCTVEARWNKFAVPEDWSA